jgi:DNA-binding transcriptional MerR regulator
MFNVNTSLIRFWEKEFQVISPKKNRKGNRLFTIRDIENINKIYHLVKIKGFTLEGAKNSLKAKEDYSHEEKSSVNEELIERLKAIKELLLSMKTN